MFGTLCVDRGLLIQDGYRLKLVAEHTWADCPQLGQAAFSPDGATLYLMKQPSELNLGAAAVTLWPEYLAILALVVLWTGGKRIAFAVRHRQQRGRVYCRGCGYDLSGAAEVAVCSECGKSIRGRGRVAGKGLARRALPWVAAVMVVTAGAACAYLLHWRSAVPEWLIPSGPCSRTAYIWAANVSAEMADAVAAPAGELVRIDSRTGAADPTPTAHHSRCFGGLRLSPDGQTAYLTGFRRSMLVHAVDVATGAEVAQRSIAGRSPGDVVVGFDGSGRALVAESDQATKRATVSAWDPRTGQDAVVLDEPAGVLDLGALPLLMTPSYAVSHDGSRLVSVSSSLGGSPVEVAVTSTQTRERVVVAGDWSHVSASSGHFDVNGDGSMLYLPVSGNPACWSLPSGDKLSPARERTRYLNDSCCSAPAAGLVAVASPLDNSLLVLRWGTAETVAEIVLPRRTVVKSVAAAADGRHIAVVGFDYVGGARPKGVRYVHRVYLYEVIGAQGKP